MSPVALWAAFAISTANVFCLAAAGRLAGAAALLRGHLEPGCSRSSLATSRELSLA
jgi:hypothetical protein